VLVRKAVLAAVVVAAGVAVAVFVVRRADGKPCEDTNLYTIRPDGTHRREVPAPESTFEPVWVTPTRLSLERSDSLDFIQMDQNGRTVEPANAAEGASLLRFSQVGPHFDVGRISLEWNGSKGFTIRRNGSAVAEVAFHGGLGEDYGLPASPEYPENPLTRPRLSPDGRSVAFLDRTGGVKGNVAIYTMATTGGTPRRLTRGEWDVDPVWSPDASMIAFVRLRKPGTGGGAVYVMRSNGTSQRRVAPGTSVAWSPDGSKLVINGVTARGAFGDLSVVGLDGTLERRLTTTGTVSDAPSWAPAALIAYMQEDGDPSQDKCKAGD
jgi:hypothetical protein